MSRYFAEFDFRYSKREKLGVNDRLRAAKARWQPSRAATAAERGALAAEEQALVAKKALITARIANAIAIIALIVGIVSLFHFGRYPPLSELHFFLLLVRRGERAQERSVAPLCDFLLAGG